MNPDCCRHAIQSLHATIELGRPIVLFFFPLAGSPHCTVESCSFRDALGASAVFSELDAIVIGVSQDSPETLKRFVDEHDLGYIILSDSKREAMQTFGVEKAWLGLINNRCTFVLDHDGIVRGMCEGVFDGVGHQKFAERWLIRIEHELAGRTRDVFTEESGEPIFFNPMTRDEGGSHRIKHGLQNSAKGAGVDQAPRHGAAPVAGKVPKNKKRSMRHFLSQLSHHDASAPATSGMKEHRSAYTTQNGSSRSSHDGSSNGHEDRQMAVFAHTGANASSPSLSQGSSAEKHGSIGRKSIRKILKSRRATPPPVPPTYENFDQDLRMYDDGDHQSYGAQIMASSHSSGSHRDWEKASTLSSGSTGSRSGANSLAHNRELSSNLARKRGAAADAPHKGGAVGSSAAHFSATGKEFGLSPSALLAQRSVRPQVAEVGDLSHGANMPVSFDKLSVEGAHGGSALPRRSRDAPDDVPVDATDDGLEDTEEFVTQSIDGQIKLAPRAKFEGEQASSSPVQEKNARHLFDPVTAAAAGLSDPYARSNPPLSHDRAPHSPLRTTSRISSIRPSSQASTNHQNGQRSSVETARPGSRQSQASGKQSRMNGQISRQSSFDDFGRNTPNGNSRPQGALGPPPPRPSSRTSHQRTVTDDRELGRDSLDATGSAQIQAAKRLVIHKDPVSPKRMSRTSSVAKGVGKSPRTVVASADTSRPVVVRSGRAVPPVSAPGPSHHLPPAPETENTGRVRRPLRPSSASSTSSASTAGFTQWNGTGSVIRSSDSSGSHTPSWGGSQSSFGPLRRPSEASSIASIQSTGTFGPRRSSQDF